MLMKTIQGNLIHLAQNGEFDLIVHGCNCFCTMGAGIAKGIKAAFRELCRPFRAWDPDGRWDPGRCPGLLDDAPLGRKNGEEIDTIQSIKSFKPLPETGKERCV